MDVEDDDDDCDVPVVDDEEELLVVELLVELVLLVELEVEDVDGLEVEELENSCDDVDSVLSEYPEPLTLLVLLSQTKQQPTSTSS